MFCPQCGTQLPDGASFCGTCGCSLQSRINISGSQNYSHSQQPVQQLPVQQPVQQWPVAPVAQKAPKPPKPKKERKPLPPPTRSSKALTVLLCILLSVLLILASVIGVIRGMLSDDSLYALLDEIDINSIELSADGTTQTLEEAINAGIDHTTPDILSWTVELDEDEIESLYETDEVRDFIVETITGYTDYFTKGEKMRAIDADDIVDFIMDNETLILKETGCIVSFGDRGVMVSEMNRYVDFSAFDSPESIEENLGISLSLISFVLSPLCYYLLIGLCAVCIILIVVINRKNLPACMTKVGVTALILAGLMLLIGIAMIVANMIVELPFAAIVSPIISHIGFVYLLRGGMALLVGLMLILVYKYFFKKRAEV